MRKRTEPHRQEVRSYTVPTVPISSSLLPPVPAGLEVQGRRRRRIRMLKREVFLQSQKTLESAGRWRLRAPPSS